jgi:hypothetical protein
VIDPEFVPGLHRFSGEQQVNAGARTTLRPVNEHIDVLVRCGIVTESTRMWRLAIGSGAETFLFTCFWAASSGAIALRQDLLCIAKSMCSSFRQVDGMARERLIRSKRTSDVLIYDETEKAKKSRAKKWSVDIRGLATIFLPFIFLPS